MIVDDDDKIECKKSFIHISQVANVCKSGIEDFIWKALSNFFKRNNLTIEWMETDPDLWPLNSEFRKCQANVKSIKVVYDVAERNIHLQYNNILKKDEMQVQYIMQCLEDYRRSYPTVNKRDLLQ